MDHERVVSLTRAGMPPPSLRGHLGQHDQDVGHSPVGRPQLPAVEQIARARPRWASRWSSPGPGQSPRPARSTRTRTDASWRPSAATPAFCSSEQTATRAARARSTGARTAASRGSSARFRSASSRGCSRPGKARGRRYCTGTFIPNAPSRLNPSTTSSGILPSRSISCGSTSSRKTRRPPPKTAPPSQRLSRQNGCGEINSG